MLTSGKLTIDLAAVRKNWQLARAQCAKSTECAAVVKADGYGLGAEKITAALYQQGCRTFFVASLEEACALESLALPSLQICILDGLRPGEEQRCAESSFVPVLFTLDQIQRWSVVNIRRTSPGPCIIKVDTGMNRLGLTASEFRMLCEQPDLIRSCHPRMLMSHLACADEAEHPLNSQQLALFRRCGEAIKTIVPDIKLSLANSSGIYLHSDYHFDLVRAGVCLYGVNPQPYRDNPMTPVVILSLPIVQIKEVIGPAAVGYGATFEVPAGDKRILAVALGGYADGIFRYLGNVGHGVIAGQVVPMVGRVSMDTTVFDISSVATTVREESSVIDVIDQRVTVDDVAKSAGTIGYEILTALGGRYHRDYLS